MPGNLNGEHGQSQALSEKQQKTREVKKPATESGTDQELKPKISERIAEKFRTARKNILGLIRKDEKVNPEEAIENIAEMPLVKTDEEPAVPGSADVKAEPPNETGIGVMRKLNKSHMGEAALLAGSILAGAALTAKEASADSYSAVPGIELTQKAPAPGIKAFNSALPGVSAVSEDSGITHKLQQVSGHEAAPKSYMAPSIETSADVARAVKELRGDEASDFSRKTLQEGLGKVTEHLGPAAGTVVKLIGDNVVSELVDRAGGIINKGFRHELSEAMRQAGVSESALHALSDDHPSNMGLSYTVDLPNGGKITVGAETDNNSTIPKPTSIAVNFSTNF